MRIVVVGSGALGSIYAAYLTRGGHDVALISRGQRAGELTEHGVSVVGNDAFTARCEIVTDPSGLEYADLVIVAVKTYDTASAVAPLAGLQAGCVLSVQNGVAKNDQLAAVFGLECVVGAASMVSGEVMAADAAGVPGPVRYTREGVTLIGERGGGTSERVDAVVEALADSGLEAASSDDIDSVEWSKLVGWSGGAAAAVLTRLPSAVCLSDPGTARLAARVMRETGAVASQLGVGLQDDPPMRVHSVVSGSEDAAVDVVLALGAVLAESAPDLRQSILQDADRGRRLEIDETLGYTLRLAAEHNLEAPTLELCFAVLNAISHAASPTNR